MDGLFIAIIINIYYQSHKMFTIMVNINVDFQPSSHCRWGNLRNSISLYSKTFRNKHLPKTVVWFEVWFIRKLLRKIVSQWRELFLDGIMCIDLMMKPTEKGKHWIKWKNAMTLGPIMSLNHQIKQLWNLPLPGLTVMWWN